MVETKVIDILNKDAAAKNLMKSFNTAAKRHGLNENEYAKAREIVLMLAIYRSKEAMKAVADDVWEALNAKEPIA